MRLGVIADDFTGATDIASFLVQNGLPTIQFNGVPSRIDTISAQAIVISLKSRSCPAPQAVELSLDFLQLPLEPHVLQGYHAQVREHGRG